MIRVCIARSLYDNRTWEQWAIRLTTTKERINMAAYEDFLSQIKEAGIGIQNEAVPTTKARPLSDGPSAAILCGCRFTPDQAQAILDNTMLTVRRG